MKPDPDSNKSNKFEPFDLYDSFQEKTQTMVTMNQQFHPLIKLCKSLLLAAELPINQG